MRALVLVLALALPMLAIAGCASNHSVDPTPTPSGSIDVIGAWHDCASTLTFAEGGTATYVDHRRGCTTTGTFSIDGNVLEATWTDATCAHDAHWIREVVRPDGGLVIVDPTTAATTRLADDATPRARYRFDTTTTPPRSSTVRIVGTPGMGVGSGCYWSTDGECGGLFSCSGSILSWESDAGGFHATTGCSGECPCGAVIDGVPASDGSFSATYRGASCEEPLDGSFTVTTLPD